MKRYIILSLLLACIGMASFAQQIPAFRVDADRMKLFSSNEEDLAAQYFIRTNDGRLTSYLPYYYGSDTERTLYKDALDFTEPVLNLTVKKKKNGAVVYRFDIRHTVDNYHFVLTNYPNGRTLIEITSDRRDPITFEGRRTDG